MPLAVLLLSWMPCSPPQIAREAEYEALGRRLLEAAPHAPPAEDRRATGEQRLLARLAALHEVFDLGVTEVWLPVRGLERDGEVGKLARPKAWPEIARFAVELERRWYELLAPADASARERGRAALDALARFAKRLQPKSAVPTDAELLDAACELRRQWSPDDFRYRIVVAPTRAQYVGLIGAAGLELTANRFQVWTELSARAANTYFLPSALAFALVGGPLSEDDEITRERELEAEALRTYAAHALAHQLSNLLLPGAPLWFGEGLALCDTVAVVGVDETLCSGYSGRKATSVDDLGSALGNALIYARVERSPFRTGGCKDLFVDELRKARVEGGFRVFDLDTSRAGVTLPGPFLLERALLPDPVAAGPRGLKEGYAEFFRAYSGAFVAFLSDQRAGDTTLLAAALREMHARRADDSPERRRLSTVLGELTGKTLGRSMDPERDLEGAFAVWLGTRR
ncbi:MAG TPA: hypothetical protein VMT18_10500 [Planctomycetota bacterium]|nr:hypothetical protein [Planctomycetota bacterium]